MFSLRYNLHETKQHATTTTTTMHHPINSFQFNCICVALNHHYSLKGLNSANIYTPVSQPPKRTRKNSLNQQGRNHEEERRVGDPTFQECSGMQCVP